MEWSLSLLEYTGHCFNFLENVLLLEDKENRSTWISLKKKMVMIKLIVSSSRNRDKAVKK